MSDSFNRQSQHGPPPPDGRLHAVTIKQPPPARAPLSSDFLIPTSRPCYLCVISHDEYVICNGACQLGPLRRSGKNLEKMPCKARSARPGCRPSIPQELGQTCACIAKKMSIFANFTRRSMQKCRNRLYRLWILSSRQSACRRDHINSHSQKSALLAVCDIVDLCYKQCKKLRQLIKISTAGTA